MRNFVGLDEMPPTLRGRFSTDGKRTQKGAKKASPFLYIYSLQRALFGMVLGMGGGIKKSILLKGGEGSGKNDGLKYFVGREKKVVSIN